MIEKVSPEGAVHVGVDEAAPAEPAPQLPPDPQPTRTNHALEQHRKHRDEDFSLGEEAFEWWKEGMEWVLCPPPIVERIVRVVLCIALHAVFITLVVTGLVGGDIKEDFEFTVPIDSPLLVDLSGCSLVIRQTARDEESVLFRNTTVRSAWRSLLALNVFTDVTSSNKIAVQDCGDHTRLTCEVMQAEPGFLISAVLEVPEGTPLPAISVIAHTQERSELRVEGAVNFANGIGMAGFEMHMIATELQTTDLTAKISHGLVDVRRATFSSAYIEVADSAAVSWHSANDLTLNMPNEADPDNLCLTSQTDAPPSLNRTSSSASVLLRSSSARREGRRRSIPELTVLRHNATTTQVHVAVGTMDALKTAENTLDSTPGEMKIQANLSQAVQLAIDDDFEVLRFHATGPSLAEALNSGQDEFVWVKQGSSYLWLSLPWMWVSSMTFFAPTTNRIPVVVKQKVCIRKEEVLVREATGDWICPALTEDAQFQDYEDLYALLLPELQLDPSFNASQAELKAISSRSTFDDHAAFSVGGVLTGSLSITALNEVFDFRPYSNVVGSRVRIQDPSSDRMGPAGRTLLALHWIIATLATITAVVYIEASWKRLRRKHLTTRGDALFPGVWSMQTGVVEALAAVDGGAQELTLAADPPPAHAMLHVSEGGEAAKVYIKVGREVREVQWREGASRADGRVQGGERAVVRVARSLPGEAVDDQYAIFKQTDRAKCRSSLLLWYFVDIAVATESQGYSQCPCVGLPVAVATVVAHWLMIVGVHLLPGALSLSLVLVDLNHCCTSYRLLGAGDHADGASWPAILVGSLTIVSYVVGLVYTIVFYATDLSARQELAVNPSWAILAWQLLREGVKLSLMGMGMISIWWVALALLWVALGALTQPYKFVPLLLGVGLVVVTAWETYKKLKEAKKTVQHGVKEQIKTLESGASSVRKHYRAAKRLLVEDGVSEEGILFFTVTLAVVLLLSVAFILIGVTSFLHIANLTSTVVSSILMLSTALAVVKAGGGKGDKMKAKAGKGSKELIKMLELVQKSASDAAQAVDNPAGRSSAT